MPLASRSKMSAAFVNAVRSGGFATQSRFGFHFAPGLVGHAAERETRLLDAATLDVQGGRDRHQRERIGQTVADLQIAVVGREALAAAAPQPR